MRDAVFGRLKLGVEHFAGVAAGEVAGFGNRVENLNFGCAMHREIVDWFMGDGIFANIRRRRKHAKNGFGVGESNWFSLVLRTQF